MTNYYEIFNETMLFEELLAEIPGRPEIDVQLPHVLWTDVKVNEELQLPPSLINFYESIELIQVAWVLDEKELNLINILKKDEFLKENYFDLDFSWEVVRDMLGGVMMIATLEDLLNPELRKSQHHYYTMTNTEGYNPDEFLSFDRHWDLSACLKIEGDHVVDNVWLVHDNAEAVYDMGISIEKYLDLAYKSKAFYYWQLIYLFKDKTENYELMKRFLPKMLPHIKLDLTAFGM